MHNIMSSSQLDNILCTIAIYKFAYYGRKVEQYSLCVRARLLLRVAFSGPQTFCTLVRNSGVSATAKNMCVHKRRLKQREK